MGLRFIVFVRDYVSNLLRLGLRSNCKDHTVEIGAFFVLIENLHSSDLFEFTHIAAWMSRR